MTVPPVPLWLRSRVANGMFWIAFGIINAAGWICPEKDGEDYEQ